MFDPHRIREDFPILKRKVNDHPLIYFDNAATTQKPRQVIDAERDFYENHNANVHRAVHTLSQEATELHEGAREKIAKFINAKESAEIVFVRGTTEAINLVAYSWGLRNLKEGDEVLLSLMEHHSNIVPWEIISKITGFTIKYAKVNPDGTLDYEDFESKFSSKTKLACLSHVSNVSGVINDVKRIAKVAHEHGALMLVDGAQSVPHMPVDVQGFGRGFSCFFRAQNAGTNRHRRTLRQKSAPRKDGAVSRRRRNDKGSLLQLRQTERCGISWNDPPWKFEAGTPNIAAASP